MTPQRWQHVQAVVAAALQRPAGERQAFLHQACADDPALRAEVEALLAPTRQADRDGCPPAEVTVPLPARPSGEETAPPRATPPDSGDPLVGADTVAASSLYRPLRFHAKGGLGEVYVAHDEQLRRQVALKRIQKRFGDDPQSRQRFLREAEVTAQLEHPGIVPVHGLGQTEDGQPCYAMRFIQGETLQAAIERFHAADRPGRDPGERSLALRQLLGRFVAVCNAVAYAHSRGFVHRDLKPANVMLGQYGETLVVDWGLAKPFAGDEPKPVTGEGALAPVVDPGIAGATVDGQAVGTPAYMSPEQAAGRWEVVGPASDLYSLGATLYALLTGQAPVQGKDVPTVLEQVRRGNFPPPRQRKAATPKALEAVCLKAMAQRPEERYATALELAADVEHWLADEPVAAYPEPWTTRARRWARRHRTPVVAVAAVLLATVVLGGGGWWWLEQARAARAARNAEQINQALAEATRLWSQARAGGDLDKWTEALSAAKRARGLLDGDPTEPALAHRVRQLQADLTREARDVKEKALQARRDRRMVARLEEARLKPGGTKTNPFDSRRMAAAYAAAFREYGIDIRALRPAEAAAKIRQRPIQEALVTALDNWALEDLGGQQSGIWRWLIRVARLADRNPHRNHIRAILEGLESRETLPGLRRLASRPQAVRTAAYLVLLGSALGEMGDVPAAVRLFRRGQRRHPEDFGVNFQLAFYLEKLKPPRWNEALRFYSVALALRRQNAVVWNNLGTALAEQGDQKGAVAAYRQAIHLKKDFPEAHYNLGNILSKQRDWKRAVACYRQAIRLRKAFPEASNNLGNALSEQGDQKGAIAAFRRAIRLRKDSPEAHLNLGNALFKQGNQKEALAAYRRAIRLQRDNPEAHYSLGLALFKQEDWKGATAAFRQAIGLKKDFSVAHYNLGYALVKQGDLKGAIAAFRQAIRFKKDYAEAHYNLGLALFNQGNWGGAIAEYRRAIRFKKDYPEAHNNLGFALFNQGDLKGAVAAYLQAIRLQQDFPEAHYNLGNALFNQGDFRGAGAAYRRAIRLKQDFPEAHCNLGLALQRMGRYTRALAALERGHALGSKNRHWPYHSQQWIDNCKHLIDLDKKLPDVLAGKRKLASAEEALAFALLCKEYKQLYAASARFFDRAFKAKPELAGDLPKGYRYNAAGAAALAGWGKGKDVAELEDKERAHWRQQALAWLRADLALWAKQLDGGQPQARALVQKVIRHWQGNPDLAGLRDAAALAKLPEVERKGWGKLWADVDSLRKRAQK
jgi:tetratricopeptide (TPR) repeat protein/tRNA A-37 threonylcarbamoyl transferase component Bud32